MAEYPALGIGLLAALIAVHWYLIKQHSNDDRTQAHAIFVFFLMWIFLLPLPLWIGWKHHNDREKAHKFLEYLVANRCVDTGKTKTFLYDDAESAYEDPLYYCQVTKKTLARTDFHNGYVRDSK